MPQDERGAGAEPLLLRVQGVSKLYPGVRALDNVNLSVRHAEVHGVIGGNGAGKSTLMGVISGAVIPEEGEVDLDGAPLPSNPEGVRDQGVAIVRQEPTLLPDLTIIENFYLTLPEAKRPKLGQGEKVLRDSLSGWVGAAGIRSGTRASDLEPEMRFVVDLARAFYSGAKLVILDEPTEHLSSANTEVLFSKMSEHVGRGGSIIYISHRLQDVRRVADRVTVLRDGQTQGTFETSEVDEDDLVSLVIGRRLSDEFPPKAVGLEHAAEVLRVSDLTGRGFEAVSFVARKGEIVGLAGIEQNGHHETLRALAGLEPSRGEVIVDGAEVSLRNVRATWRQGIGFLTGDRPHEGVFAPLSVRENFSIRSVEKDVRGGQVRRGLEATRAQEAVRRYGVKTPDIETPIRNLSGGNQQKVLIASVAAADPSVMLFTEPTQGVDVGARADIYATLRAAAQDGAGLVIVSSDGAELAGLCDRVLVFSSGQIIAELHGDALTEERITETILKSTALRSQEEHKLGLLDRFHAAYQAPLLVAAFVTLLLGVVASIASPHYLTTHNFSGVLALVATLAIVSYGQQLVMLIGEIDMSVGPLMGLVGVVASFFLVDGVGGAGIGFGLLLMLAVSLSVGFANFSLVQYLRLHPMVATLATYMAVQAVSLLLRPEPGGLFDFDLMDAIGARIGFVPVSFLIAVVIGLVLEYVLFRRRTGVAVRSMGSSVDMASKAGLRQSRMRLLGYLGAAFFAFLAAIPMMAQVGIGEPRAGLSYTLLSIAAVVVGGGQFSGGRGSFVGALLGAILLNQINTIAAFLQFNDAWNLILQGGVILIGAVLYSKNKLTGVPA